MNFARRSPRPRCLHAHPRPAAALVLDKVTPGGTRRRTRLRPRAGAGGNEVGPGQPLRVSRMAGGSQSHGAVLWDEDYYTARVVPMRTAAGGEGEDVSSISGPAWRVDDGRYSKSRASRAQQQCTQNRLRQTWSRQRGARPAGRQLGRTTATISSRENPRQDRRRSRNRADNVSDTARVGVDPRELRTGSRHLAFRGDRCSRLRRCRGDGRVR